MVYCFVVYGGVGDEQAEGEKLRKKHYYTADAESVRRDGAKTTTTTIMMMMVMVVVSRGMGGSCRHSPLFMNEASTSFPEKNWDTFKTLVEKLQKFLPYVR